MMNQISHSIFGLSMALSLFCGAPQSLAQPASAPSSAPSSAPASLPASAPVVEAATMPQSQPASTPTTAAASTQSYVASCGDSCKPSPTSPQFVWALPKGKRAIGLGFGISDDGFGRLIRFIDATYAVGLGDDFLLRVKLNAVELGFGSFLLGGLHFEKTRSYKFFSWGGRMGISGVFFLLGGVAPLLTAGLGGSVMIERARLSLGVDGGAFSLNAPEVGGDVMLVPFANLEFYLRKKFGVYVRGSFLLTTISITEAIRENVPSYLIGGVFFRP